MNKITKVAVHTRRLKSNASANRYGEPIIDVRCEELDCGVVMLQDSRRINIDACDHDLGEAMVILWNDMKMNEIIKEWYTAEGEKGFIKASRFFLKCFGEMALTMFAKFEAEESSVG
jgi:hypothetical protein